jgi:hypothetical protein
MDDTAERLVNCIVRYRNVNNSLVDVYRVDTQFTCDNCTNKYRVVCCYILNVFKNKFAKTQGVMQLGQPLQPLPLLDEPVCGFTGSKCNHTTEIVVGCLVLIAIVIASAAYPTYLRW